MRIAGSFKASYWFNRFSARNCWFSDLYLLALTNQVNHIATTRNDARHDKIPQRMQIMMHQGVDRRDIKLMVQEHETLS